MMKRHSGCQKVRSGLTTNGWNLKIYQLGKRKNHLNKNPPLLKGSFVKFWGCVSFGKWFVSDKGLAAANPFLEHSKRPVVLAMSCEYTS